MTILKKNIPVWLTWSTCSIALLPISSNAINSICLMTWVALMLLSFLLSEDRQRHAAVRNIPFFLLIGGNFILLALSLLYSVDLPRGTSYLTTSLPMLLFPVCFFILGMPEKDRNGLLDKTLTTFWLSTILMSLWVIGNFWRLHLLGSIGQASSFNTILRETAEKLTDKHPDYLSIYLVFAIYIAVVRFISHSAVASRLIYGVSIFLMLFLLLVLAARSPILALIIGSLVICFLRIKKPWIRWSVPLLLLGAFILLIRLTPAIYSRAMEFRNTSFTTPVGMEYNSTNIRAGIYHCSWELIRQHILTGIGAGSDNKLLTDCYSQFPTDAYRKVFYNTHNQYVNFWLLSGIFSLLLFAASLIYLFSLAIRKNDHLLLFFLILMSIAFTTENVLSRQAGVVFYYFFACLMATRYIRVTPARGRQ